MAFLDPQDALLAYSDAYINASGNCQWKRKQRSNGAAVSDSGQTAFTTRAAQICPANSSLSGSTCVCASGYVEDSNHTACVIKLSELEQFCKDAVAYKNSFPQSGTIASTSSMPVASCYKPQPPFSGADAPRGCAMRLGDGVMVPHDSNPLLRHWSATGVPTGATCEDSAASDVAPKSTPDPCPDGFAGTVNGTAVCVKREPDKGIEGVKTTEKKNADGTSTTTKETTKCEGGQCTTTTETTTKDATGAQVGPVKVEETKEGIGGKCSKDPGNKVCGAVGMGNGEGGGGFTGTCASGFKATGEDPVLNAMALEQYKRNCDFFEKKPDATEESSAYDSMKAKGKQGGDQTGDLPGDSKRDYSIGPNSFDYTSAIAAQQCFTDRSFSMWGHSYAIPLSIVCPWLAVLGNILVVVASLLAARIVVRG